MLAPTDRLNEGAHDLNRRIMQEGAMTSKKVPSQYEKIDRATAEGFAAWDGVELSSGGIIEEDALPILKTRRITVYQEGRKILDGRESERLQREADGIQKPASALASVFYVLGVLEILGGFVLAAEFSGVLSGVSIAAGIIFGCLFFAVGQGLTYLRDIRDSLKRD
jgi:hypothetical protein